MDELLDNLLYITVLDCYTIQADLFVPIFGKYFFYIKFSSFIEQFYVLFSSNFLFYAQQNQTKSEFHTYFRVDRNKQHTLILFWSISVYFIKVHQISCSFAYQVVQYNYVYNSTTRRDDSIHSIYTVTYHIKTINESRLLGHTVET